MLIPSFKASRIPGYEYAPPLQNSSGMWGEKAIYAPLMFSSPKNKRGGRYILLFFWAIYSPSLYLKDWLD